MKDLRIKIVSGEMNQILLKERILYSYNIYNAFIKTLKQKQMLLYNSKILVTHGIMHCRNIIIIMDDSKTDAAPWSWIQNRYQGFLKLNLIQMRQS